MYPIIASLLLTATATPDAIGLHAVQQSIDRGEVRTGASLVQSFDVQYRGTSGTLSITAIETPCGCLKPSASKSQLRPGEKSIITVTVNTLTQPEALHTWRVKVRYRIMPDAGLPQPPDVQPDAELELKLSATLLREITVTPPMIALSTTGETTQTLSVRDHRAKSLTVLTATTTSPHLTATIVPTAATENGVRAIPISVHLKDSYPTGQNDETVVLTTDDPLYPELRVPIRVLKRKAGGIVPSPDSVEVRVSKSLDESSTLLQLRAPNRGAIRVAKIDCDHPAIRTRFASDAALAVTVRVIVTREGAQQQNGQATLHVTFADPIGETLAIPVSWILEK